jgi:hypothetical protein
LLDRACELHPEEDLLLGSPRWNRDELAEQQQQRRRNLQPARPVRTSGRRRFVRNLCPERALHAAPVPPPSAAGAGRCAAGDGLRRR